MSALGHDATWQAVIGLEIHAQLNTRSKLFSGGSTAYGAEPNSQANIIDVALPGTLPTINRAAVEKAICFGLAIGAPIATRSQFARKNYFYPDLSKGYQISQFEQPVVGTGSLDVRLPDGSAINVEIQRAHLEEDAGKSLHEAFAAETGIDFNRAGTPLLEIVSSPVMHSAVAAVAYMRAVHSLVRWLDICDGNMQEGSFRCDANVSVRPVGQATLGTRAEIKNVNSFRFVEKAIDYEIERQIRAIESGETIRQETRLYDAAHHRTRSMRSKENADDYRYFPDPDLPALMIEASEIERVRATLPELPHARQQRYVGKLGLSDADAAQLCGDRATADYFEAMLHRLPAQPRLCAHWLLGELNAALNAAALSIDDSRVTAPALAELVASIDAGSISGKIGKEVFMAMWAGEGGAAAIIEKKGLGQISDSGALASIVEAVLAQFPQQVEDYRKGNDKLLQFFIGQVMKGTRGQANPQQLQTTLLGRLASPD